MVKRKKNKNIKQIKKKNNILRFSAISLLVIFSFFTLPTINNFSVLFVWLQGVLAANERVKEIMQENLEINSMPEI